MQDNYAELNERLSHYFRSTGMQRQRPTRRPFLQEDRMKKQVYLMEYDYDGSTVQATGERAENLLKLNPVLRKVIQQYVEKGFTFEQ
jgi:hypothetical protein